MNGSSTGATKRELLVALGVTLILGALYGLTSASGSTFYFADSSRHAMNGAFVLDFLRAHPLHGAWPWAQAYYLQHPAITIGFYPPLHAAQLAFIYALFGVSQTSADILIGIHAALAAGAFYALCRRRLDLWGSLAGAALLLLSPTLLFWGRQVMLESAMLAFAMWSLVLFLAYLDNPRPWRLFWSAMLLVAALYSKQIAGVLVPVYLVALIVRGGCAALRRPHLWLIALAALIALVPLALLQLKFGAFNVQTVVDRPDIGIARWSIAGWSYYAVTCVTGLALGVLALLAPAGVVARLIQRRSIRLDNDALVMLAWLILGYIALGLIALKEPRHGVIIYPPLIYLALRLAAALPQQIRFPLLGLAVAGSAIIGLSKPAPYATGSAAAVDAAMRFVPRGGRMAAYVYRDGNVVFDTRARYDRRDATVVRVDKLLLQIRIMPGLGVKELNAGLTPKAVEAMLVSYGVRSVISERRLWDDKPSVQAFYAALQRPDFRRVATIVQHTHDAEKPRLFDVYEVMAAPPAHPTPLSADTSGGQSLS